MAKKSTPQAFMSPAQLLRRLTLSTSQDPRVLALRARLLPAAADSKKPDIVEKSVNRPGKSQGPKRRQQVTVHGKHGTYQSRRLVGSDKPAPTAPTPTGQPTLAFDTAHPCTGTLHGVKFAPWEGVPQTDEAWAQVEGQDPYLEEPPIPPLGKKTLGSGVIIREKDGRVWLVKPTNSFGGYNYTFPKGGQEEGLSLQANAIKETFEEAGLQVKITGYAGDVERDTSIARYYYAERVGGSPSEHGWESEAVVLVDPQHAHQFLNKPVDQHLAHQHAGAPTPPPPPPKPAYQAPPKMKPGSYKKPSSAAGLGQGSLFGGPPKPKPAAGTGQPDLFSQAAGKPSLPQLPSKKTLTLLAPTEPTLAALGSQNGPALKAMQMVQQLVASGDLKPAVALPMVQAVEASDPNGSTALLVDFYKKRLSAYLSQLAGPPPAAPAPPAAAPADPTTAALIEATNKNKEAYGENIRLPSTYQTFKPQNVPTKGKKNKLCYSNALQGSKELPGMSLAIGYLTAKKPNSAGYIETTPHAWLVTAGGRVFDPTLGKYSTDHYVGRLVPPAEAKGLKNGDDVRELLFSETQEGYTPDAD